MAEKNVDLVLRARDNASAAFQNLNGALQDLTGVQQRVARGAELMSAAISGGAGDLRRLNQALESGDATDAARAYDQIGAAVERMGAKLREQQAAVQENRQAYVSLAGQLENARNALARMNEAIGPRSQQDVARIEATEAAIRGLTAESRRAEQALNRSQAELDGTTQDYNRLSQAAAVAEANVREFGAAQERSASSAAAWSVAAARLAQSQVAAARAAEQNRRAVAESAAEQERARAALNQSFPALRRLTAEFRRGYNSYRRAAQGAEQFAAAATRAGRSARFMEGEVIGARRAFAAFYGDSRRALSLMQRLRGEVLSLAAAFVGFYGVFEQGNQVVQSFQAIQAATNRMEAAVGGNVSVAAQELGFLRTEADRLGFSFETLATNYSSFLISGQQAGLEMDDVRRIFVSVTEASRVLGLNNERVGRVFTALTQIAGKGTVQMEELRQQLGDNLPGAVGILAEALGYGTDELDKFYDAVEAGNVGAQEGLLALADGLDETFGNQLSASLESVNAQIGRLQNNLFNRRLTAANSGFIDGLETLLDALNRFLSSADGVRLFEAMGAAAGRFLEILPGIFENLDAIGTAIRALVAFKLAQLVQAWAAGFAAMLPSLTAVRAGLAGVTATMATVPAAAARVVAGAGTAAGAMAALGRAVAVAGGALRGFFGLLLGPLGFAALTALSFAAVGTFAQAATEVDVTNSALTQHERIIDSIRTAYNEAEEAGTDWLERLRNGINDLSETQIRGAIADTEAAIDQLLDGFEDIRRRANAGTLFGDDLSLEFGGLEVEVPLEATRNLTRLVREFEQGRVSVEQFQRRLQQLQQATNSQAFDRLAARVLETATEVDGLRQNSEFLEAALAVLNGTANQTQLSMVQGAVAVGQLGDAANAEIGALDAFNASLQGVNAQIGQLLSLIPSMRAGLQLATNLERVETAYQAAIADVEALEAQSGAVGAGPGSTEAEAALAQAAAARARAEEARAQAILELNTEFDVQQAGGLGQFVSTDPADTVAALARTRGAATVSGALPEGTIEAIRQDLIPAVSGALGEAFDRLNPTQQGVIANLARDFGVDAFGEGGELADITEALRTGSAEGVAEALRNRPGVAPDIGRIDAAAFTSEGGRQAAVRLAEQQRQEAARLAEQQRRDAERLAEQEQREADRRAQAQQDVRDNIQDRISQQEFLLELEGLSTADREVALALREAENEAAEVGLELTEAEREQIEAITRARVAAEEAREGGGGGGGAGGGGGSGQTDAERAQEQARELEAEVERLQERRAFLIEEIAYAQSQGDTARATELQAELDQVNAALEEAIQRAIQFWEAMGGSGSAGAIQALRQTQAEINRLGSVTVTTGEQMNNMIANKLTSAIQRFAQRVAQGEDAWTAFKEEFLRAIGEMLIEIGVLIVRQAILNALTGGQGMGGGVGGGIAGLVNGLFHTGGIAGRTPTTTRTVDPSVFANAVRYHSGGIAGLRPNEVAAVLEEGEEVLTENDPRHRRNGGAAGSAPTIINAFDAAGFLDAALASPAGGDAVLNYVRANRETVKAALE